MSKLEAQTFLEEVCGRSVFKLKRLSFDDLLTRNTVQEIANVEPSRRKLTTTFHVKRENHNCLVVVVQCVMTEKGLRNWLGMSLTEVDGFRRYADGRVEPLDEDTIRSYR